MIKKSRKNRNSKRFWRNSPRYSEGHSNDNAKIIKRRAKDIDYKEQLAEVAEMEAPIVLDPEDKHIIEEKALEQENRNIIEQNEETIST